MNRLPLALLGTFVAALAGSAAAHHSFAIYDMQQDVEFHGVIASIKLRNPHMAMTLTTTGANGEQRAQALVIESRAGIWMRPVR